MQARPHHFRLAAGLCAALALLVAAPAAAAHTGSKAAVASNYEARLTGFQPAFRGARASVTGGDIDLALRVPAGHTVVVLGVEGEPMIRFAGGRVFGNERSPTAASARVVTLTSGTLTGPPIWKQVRTGLSYSWHESRLRPAPGRRDGIVARIAIPLRVDGMRVAVVGTSHYARPPNSLVLLGLLILALLAAATLVRLRERIGPPLVLPLAVVAVVCVLATVIGTTLYAPHSTSGAALQIAAAVLLGGGALAAIVLLRAPHRAFVATATGALCMLFTATTLPMLTHGFALSRLPTDLARLATGAAFATGGWLLLLGGLEVFLQSSRPRKL